MTKNKTYKQISATDYADVYYREYSIYINNARAIPSVIDGMKPVQRKALFSAIKHCKSDFMKVSALSGSVISEAAYHHGDVSVQEAVVGMAQDFNNNIPFFEGDGTFGTRLSPEAGAARYVFVKLSNSYYDIFKDTDITLHSLDTNDHPEPMYYLPVIPNVLLNGVRGIAIGFATTIFPRSAKTLATACIEYLKTGKVTTNLLPYYEGFNGTIRDLPATNKFECEGVFKRISKTKIQVTEVPIGITHEKYQEHLNKLRDNKFIVGYIDNSDTIFNFEITLPNANDYSDELLKRELKLVANMSENIVVVNDFKYDAGSDRSNIAIKEYSNPVDVLTDFVDFRINFYDKRIAANIARITSSIEENENKIRFITDVLSKKIKIGDLTRKDLITYMKDNKYNHDYIERIISMSIYNMTKDNMQKLNDDIAKLQKELKEWQSSTAKDLYIKDLEVIKKKYN